MTRYNFFLPDTLVAKLREVAKAKKLTLSAVIRQALVMYLNGQRPAN